MKRTGKKKAGLSIVAAVLICCMSAGTVFAYSPVGKCDVVKYDCEDELAFHQTAEVERLGALSYEEYFTDKDGKVYPLINKKADRPSAPCTHSMMVDGELTKHHKKSDGGCEFTVMEAVRCIICGFVKSGDIISITTYTKCPH